MGKRVKKSRNVVLQSLELLGKPIFFVFTFIVSYAYFIYLLFEKLFSSIKFPRPNFSIKSLLNHKLVWLSILLGFFGVLLYQYIFKDLPPITLLVDTPPSLTTNIYDRHGELLFQVYKDQNRSLIKLKDVPQTIVNATIAAEDKNFYHHVGIDFNGILRATYNNIVNCKLKTSDCTVQGGSTITQQLVKNVLLTHTKSISRKLKELILALEAEHYYTKDQILEMYLNQISYGGTAYGIVEASRQYFGKDVQDLTLAEVALLAGLPVSPTTLSPFGTNPHLTKVRQQQVLEQMVSAGFISENDKVTALAQPITLHPQGISIRAPHFVMYVKNLLVQLYGEDTVARGGLSVTTTLDLSTQGILQTEIEHELARLSSMHVQNGAGLVTNPQTGEILAMVGSRDFFSSEQDGQVNLTISPRQPGSSIKPVTYALAFMHGLSPYSMIEDAPICFHLTGQANWCPKNYDGRFHGNVPLRVALGSSYNIPATKLLNSLGLTNMVNLAKAMGITTWDDPSRFGLSLTLGGGEILMTDMAEVYGVIANGGKRVDLTSILSVKNYAGQELPLPHKTTTQVLPEGVAYQITSILSDPAARAPAFGFNSILNLPGPNVAVKTGTTNNLRDNWTFGYTPNLLVATWVGNNDNTSMSSVASGITGASPIWAHTMQQLLVGSPATPLTPPPSMVKMMISCTNQKYDYFIAGQTPQINCEKTGTLLETAASTSQ